LRLVRYADFLTLRNDSNTFFQWNSRNIFVQIREKKWVAAAV
jgi:hypothetical protein